MCGGIFGALTFSLPEHIRNNRWRLIPYVSAYNFDRITSYSLAGALAGSFGENIIALAPQNGHLILQLFATILMIGIGLYLAGWFPAFAKIEHISKPIWKKLEPISQLSTQIAVKHCLNVPHFSVKAIEHCENYTWPGNIRELKNFCERMVILLNGKTVDIDNLPAETKGSQKVKISNQFTLPENGIVLEQVEAQLINQAMDKSRGNQSKAARLLGLTRSALLYRMEKHAL